VVVAFHGTDVFAKIATNRKDMGMNLVQTNMQNMNHFLIRTDIVEMKNTPGYDCFELQDLFTHNLEMDRGPGASDI